MKQVLVAALVLTMVLPVSVAWGEGRGPSTTEERQKAVEIVRALEARPLHKDARDARGWLVVWLAEIPDITVSFCSALLGPTFEHEKKYGAELAVQQAFSSAAFMIENPAQAADDEAVRLAGVEGVLRTYQSLLAEKPKARFPSLDGLLKAKSEGTLASVVNENAKACK